jgi:hypothetical protein
MSFDAVSRYLEDRPDEMPTLEFDEPDLAILTPVREALIENLTAIV